MEGVRRKLADVLGLAVELSSTLEKKWSEGVKG